MIISVFGRFQSVLSDIAKTKRESAYLTRCKTIIISVAVIKKHFRRVNMTIEALPYIFTVCKLGSESDLPSDRRFCFTAVTDEEISLVCRTGDVPEKTIIREDGWKGFRITGVLDFSLIGILSKISGILAENRIGIFAVSTYNTDYVFVKEENFEKALSALEKGGFSVTAALNG